ncbi:MAG TPA: ATP-binding protein, partial [Actinomycetota bacterium]
VSDQPAEAAALMQETQGELRGLIGEIRTYVYGLRDGDASVDLRPALERLVAEFPSGPPSIALAIAGEPRLPAAKAANVLHIVREAAANALRHGHASHVWIGVTQGPDTLAVRVRDDGKGFDAGLPSSGFGMRDMHERAGWCRCELEVHSTPGEGTSVRIEIPLEVGATDGAPR